MKTMNLEKMESTIGGYNYIDGCRVFAWATLVSNGIEFGSAEAYIIGNLAFNSCVYQQ